MAKISLKEKLAKLSLIELFFTGITVQKTKDGESIAILQLDQPIPMVRGSQEVDFNGRRMAVTASDVIEIKVHQDDFETNAGFEWDEDTDTGSFKGSDLVLDVAKTGQVWLKSTTFAVSGNDYRAKRRNESLAKLFETGTPTSVTNAGATKGPEQKAQPVDTTVKTGGQPAAPVK